MITQVAYTNSNCEDKWPMFMWQNRKHNTFPLHFISDKAPSVNQYDDIYIYKNEDPHWMVWKNALKMFNLDYFIFLMEDFILYDDVKEEKIEEYISFLKNNPEYSFVRLLKGTTFKEKKLSETLYELESSNKYVFAMQPTIWRTSDYVRIMDEVRATDWFETPIYRRKIMRMGIKGAYHYDGERKAGKYHYDSNVYPYIATATVNGKWNVSEYAPQLLPLMKLYNIDGNKRGYS